MIKKGENIICKTCGKEFYVSKCFIGKRINCSIECANKSYKKEDAIKTLICEYCNKEYQRYASYLLIRKSKYCSKQCMDNASKLRCGEKSKLYKGNNPKRIRKGSDWKMWRNEVFKRDNYTCVTCNTKGDYLHPHHVKQSAYFPEHRFDVNNGITLCVKCHKILHKEFKTRKNSNAYKKYDIETIKHAEIEYVKIMLRNDKVGTDI